MVRRRSSLLNRRGLFGLPLIVEIVIIATIILMVALLLKSGWLQFSTPGNALNTSTASGLAGNP